MAHVVDLPTAVPSELESDFLGKLHYVSEDLASFRLEKHHSARVHFATRPGRDGSAGEISARIREVAAKLCSGYRELEPRVLVSRRPGTFQYAENPRARLEARGDLFDYGPGRFGLGPIPTRLEEYFEAGVLRLADQLGAERYRFPVLVGAEILHRCRYMESFPHALTLTSHLREDLDAINTIALFGVS